MSEFESPERAAGTVSIDDVHELMGASTPHFAMHIRARLQRLVKDLPEEHPARLLAQSEISRLGQIAVGGEKRGSKVPGESRLSPEQPITTLASDTSDG